MSIYKEQANSDFEKAYSKGLFSKILSRLQNKHNSLLSFQEVLKYVKAKNEIYKGMQCILISEIIGSEGRYNDFSKEFLPKRRNLKKRWVSIDEAHYNDITLPPIRAYKLGKSYFVRDGNHRVSVSREQGREFIDAEVIEIIAEIEISPDTTKEQLFNIIIEHEREVFLKTTKLDESRDTSMITFTFPGRYDAVLNHISGHQYFLGIDNDKSVSFNEAVISWYDNLFIPIIEDIEKEKILYRFPKRTSADLYAWIINHWDELKKKYGENVGITDAVKSYNHYFGQNTLKSFFVKLKKLFKG